MCGWEGLKYEQDAVSLKNKDAMTCVCQLCRARGRGTPRAMVVVSAYSTTAICHSEREIAFLRTVGQVLRATDLSFTVGDDFNLAGELLQPARLASRTTSANRCGKQCHANMLGPDEQRDGHRFLRGTWRWTTTPQPCAPTVPSCQRWRK